MDELFNAEALKDVIKLAKPLLQELEGWIKLLSEPPYSLLQYSPDLSAVYDRLKSGFGSSPDVLLRWIVVPSCAPHKVLVASIDGLSDTQMVDQDIIAPLLKTTTSPASWGESTITPGHIHSESQWDKIIEALAAGNTLIFAPGFDKVWVVDTVKYRQRSIGRPQTELSVRGPEEAFNEVILTQMNQLRQRILDPQLRFHKLTVGTRQHTTVVLAYIEGLANPSLIQTCLNRLEHVKISGHANSTLIAGLIRDHPRSIFPTIRATERVDIACWRLLEGKVVILVDGDPFVLIAPAPLGDFYRTAMDYSGAWYDTSFVRMIRLLGWILGIYFPALYIALTEVNPNLIPSTLLVITLGDHAALPFSPFVEAILMVVIVEVLREAALRLPKPMSTTIGTVGAIVVGTAVVKAGFVSPQIIVVITLTALSFYSVPVYELTGTWRIVNVVMLLVSAVMGILGILLVTLLLIGMLSAMTSFGTPYFEPATPFRRTDWKDYLIRVPWTVLRTRLSAARPLAIVTSQHEKVPEPVHLKRGRAKAGE
ncbi:spore germination protein [Sulfobacillus thermosulfidooxidans]|uniref:spore germination protein n=1 Tax=Sulfobacillus thermosulfidooxidans TaxID=28034 RepID=UPI00096B8DB7|nr:spore germination protein [Sulfobacillus thermosulfidooxidans]OLZ11360.1 spore gernimation protein GerA [Sulfobacillus thermosulfidooxidans]OLZ14042.1 spore gernimation protein GerA [Sulfobacillus thermosulfidooxidans]OLZ19866.1 spore gernimation protein GerA [Sulfobacillus thermosulfidooxidans]